MESQIRQIQLKCLEILDIVHGICEDNNIQYSLCGGSVVGAHLYGKCLPWDDDIDLMMTRENYNRFITIAPSLLPEGYSMLNYQVSDDFIMGLTKVINDNTTYVQENGIVLGVFIDITVYDKVPTNHFLRWIDMFLMRRSLTVLKGKMSGESLKNKVRNFILDTIWSDKRAFFISFQRVVELLANTSHYTYSELFGAWAQDISYRPSVFENYAMIEFEGKLYHIVRDYIEYLTTRYNRNDFREPKEKQVPPHVVFFDSYIPYKNYRKSS